MLAPNLLNLRELGGLTLQSGGQTRMKSLLRADTLARLTHEGMQILVDYGVRTIIDLRWPEEVEVGSYDHLLEDHLLQRVHISLLDENLAAWRGRGLHPRPKDMLNCIALENARPQFYKVLRAIAHAPAGTLLFHCHSGKDRTGLISTLLLALSEVELESIVRDYTLSEDLLREGYLVDRSDLSPEEIQLRLQCPPQQIHNTLKHFQNQYNGIEGYLLDIGLSISEIKALKQRLS
jgi:protein-tyrosine phosphatase